MGTTSLSAATAVRRLCRLGMVWGALMLAGASAQATLLLSVTPAAQTVALGAQASVDVVVDGVQPAGLGSYDLTVQFDAALLAFNQAVDGLGLGIAFGLGATPGTGSVTLSDFSLELPADLLALQGNRFTLFTLVFDTLAEGTSALTLLDLTLADADGIIVASSADGGSITVEAGNTPLPEPGTLALLAAAACAGAGMRRQRPAAKVS